jgi:hypothetical protein
LAALKYQDGFDNSGVTSQSNGMMLLDKSENPPSDAGEETCPTLKIIDTTK